jgi:TM2 domain-containing membrane protein YozV
MKFCYKCGEKIFEEAEICPKCGVRQTHPPGYAPPSQQPASGQTASGTPPQNPQPGLAPGGREGLGQQPQGTLAQPGAAYEEKKSPAIAAIASFFWCGLGHVYCGDYMFGIMLMLVFPIIAFICSITIICIPAILLMWFWGMYDAYGLAQRINRGEVKS